MRLIIVRHGETIENVEGIIQGHLPGRLTKKGKEQVRKVAKRLSQEKIDFIYSSDLSRAANTAKEIAKYHPNTPLKFISDMRERNMGEFQGMRKRDLEWDEGPKKPVPYETPKKGETLQQLYERAEKVLDLISNHKGKTVLLVGHGGINYAISATILGITYEEILKMGKSLNTSVTVFELNENQPPKLCLFNCTNHL